MKQSQGTKVYEKRKVRFELAIRLNCKKPDLEQHGEKKKLFEILRVFINEAG